MGRIALAFSTFFGVLFNRATAEKVAGALASPALPKDHKGAAERTPPATPTPQPTPPKRSEAITLLSALQREARLVDLVQEPLDQYTDEQVGSAARKVLMDSRSVLDRFFALEAVRSEPEGTTLDVATPYDPSQIHLVGSVTGNGPYRGRLTHPGWKAAQCKLPSWTGGKEAALVIAPAEVEVGR